MTLDEICLIAGKSRRQVMRLIEARLLPTPVRYGHGPMSFNSTAVKQALERLKEADHDRRKRRSDRAHMARARRRNRPNR